MMNNQISLRPSYWACVSGGKDSFYMLNLILHNLDKYPLDGVIHFELEIDYPFIHDVIDYMQRECELRGIRFLRIKPTHTWEELYYSVYSSGKQWLFPTRTCRWCNEHYKLTAKQQLEKFLKKQGYYVVSYIGYCADEEKRFLKRKDFHNVERFPLVEEGINENLILQWAKNQPVYNDYYKFNKRCGCMYCPLSSKLTLAYLLKYYPKNYDYMMQKASETELIRSNEYGKSFSVFSSNSKYNTQYVDYIVRTKYLRLLDLKENQIDLFDLL